MLERRLTATSVPEDKPLLREDKPLLRGVSHQIAFFCMAAASVALVGWGNAPVAGLVFCASLLVMFGTSALYHRGDWTERQHDLLKRLDHAMVFVAIAGGYTPLFALVPSRDGHHGALVATWVGAAIGVLRALAWPNAPRYVSTLAYVVLGWALLGEVIDRAPAVEGVCLATLEASGILYTIGALVYLTRRPDPMPRVFGYHEVFHTLVVVGCGFLFAHVVLLLRAAS
jgi:hemolysin III